MVLEPFPMRKVTIREVAKKAHLGLGTVSRVINDSVISTN
jgi:DNA-binding LacI/PurR family transcriptional regulator